MKLKKTIYPVMISAILFLFGCSTQINEKPIEPVKYVKVEKIVDQQLVEKLVFNGIIKEKSLTSISFRVGGPLTKLNVKPGDFVKAGELIAEIDKRDYELQVQSTKVQFNQMQGEFERYKQLFEKGKIPANSYEKIESGYLMAKTAYENAVNKLKDSKLTAPVSGYIYEKFVENFQTVNPGQVVVSIIDLSQLEVIISIPESQLTKIKNSSKNLLEVKNANVSNLPISILSISEKAKDDGMYEMKFTFNNNSKLKISPGMSAEISMICDQEASTIKIPSSAVFYEENTTRVWVFDSISKVVNKRNVRIKNISSGGKVEVISGLSPNDIIVIAGVHSLYENQVVRPVQPQSPTNIGGLL